MSEHLTRRAFRKSSAATAAGTAFGKTATADATLPAGTGDLPTGASGAQAAPEGATPLAMNAGKLPVIETLVRRALLQVLSEEPR